MNKKIPKIQPYRRGNIYSSVCIRGRDKFTLLRHEVAITEKFYLEIAEALGVYDTEFEKCREYAAQLTNFLAYMRPPWSPPNLIELIRAYLYQNSVSSFGIGFADSQHVTIAFRDQKDYFKYSLRFGATSRLRIWSSSSSFWVFIDEHDEIPFYPIKAEEWNSADPKGGWL